MDTPTEEIVKTKILVSVDGAQSILYGSPENFYFSSEVTFPSAQAQTSGDMLMIQTCNVRMMGVESVAIFHNYPTMAVGAKSNTMIASYMMTINYRLK